MATTTGTNTVILRTLTLEECQQVRVWRNDPTVLPMLRTKEPLTEQEQLAFYLNVICHVASNHRYYAIEHQGTFVGMGGLTYLDRIEGEAEISLILGPQFRGRGLGEAAVIALLHAAFTRLQLRAVIGECYTTNPAREFWTRMLDRMVELGLTAAPEVTHHPKAFQWTWRPPAMRRPDSHPLEMSLLRALSGLEDGKHAK